MEKLIWIDLETTGLDENSNSIIEVGVIVTDEQMNELLSTSYVIKPTTPFQEVALKMHKENGLYDLSMVSENTTQSVEEFLFDILKDYYSLWLPGSNPSFEKMWLKLHMPRIYAMLHYRSFDVNTLNMFFGAEKTSYPHRSLDDIRRDIEIVRSYLKQ